MTLQNTCSIIINILTNGNIVLTRPREYNRESVLDAVTRLFWKKGYEATSINDIVKFTGINKHSLYNDFGDKEKLFLSCADNYVKTATDSVENVLLRQPLSLSNIEDFFNNRSNYADSKDCIGCFLVNAITDQAALSTKARNKVEKLLSGYQQLFYNCLVAAQASGEISKDKDCNVLAQYLSCILNGLMISGRMKTSKSSLPAMTDMALSMLRS